MKHRINPYIIPGTCMIIVLIIAVSVFYRSTHAGKNDVRITSEEAKKISLSDAGEKADGVTFTKASLDDESGTPVYEVEFYTDEKEYDYEVNAQTGSIREKEITVHKKTRNTETDTAETRKASGDNADPEKDKDTNKEDNKSKNIDVIGVEKAQEIALKDAGMKSSQVTFTKSKLDTENGKDVYEIEFVRDGKEYEYEIDAFSGKILESNIDVANDTDDQEDADDRYDDDHDDEDDRYEDDRDDDSDDDRYDDDDDQDDDNDNDRYDDDGDQDEDDDRYDDDDQDNDDD